MPTPSVFDQKQGEPAKNICAVFIVAFLIALCYVTEMPLNNTNNWLSGSGVNNSVTKVDKFICDMILSAKEPLWPQAGIAQLFRDDNSLYNARPHHYDSLEVTANNSTVIASTSVLTITGDYNLYCGVVLTRLILNGSHNIVYVIK